MAKRNDTPVFAKHQKVAAAHDLPGIPAGSPGKVLLINGLAWVRYRVLFDLADGSRVERGMLSAGDLTTPEAWAAARRDERLAALRAERSTAGPASAPDSEGSAA